MRVKDSIPSHGRPLTDLDEFWKQHAEYDIDPKERKRFIPSLPPLAKSLYAFQSKPIIHRLVYNLHCATLSTEFDNKSVYSLYLTHYIRNYSCKFTYRYFLQ